MGKLSASPTVSAAADADYIVILAGGLNKLITALNLRKNSYRARAFGSAGSTAMTANVYMKVPINTTSFDPNSNFSTSNNRYTIPVTGCYQINAVARVDNTTDQALAQVSIYKNGVQYATGGTHMSSGTSGQIRCVYADMLELTAGDYIEVWALSTGTANLFPNSSYISVALVAPS